MNPREVDNFIEKNSNNVNISINHRRATEINEYTDNDAAAGINDLIWLRYKCLTRNKLD